LEYHGTQRERQIGRHTLVLVVVTGVEQSTEYVDAHARVRRMMHVQPALLTKRAGSLTLELTASRHLLRQYSSRRSVRPLLLLQVGRLRCLPRTSTESGTGARDA